VVDQTVPGDGEHPRSEGPGIALEAGQLAEDTEEGVVGDGVGITSATTDGEPLDLWSQPLVQRGEAARSAVTRVAEPTFELEMVWGGCLHVIPGFLHAPSETLGMVVRRPGENFFPDKKLDVCSGGSYAP